MRKKIKTNHEKFKKNSNKELYDYIEAAKKQEKKDRQTYLEALSDQLRLPSDMLAGAPIITAIGRNELYLENYKGIIEYNENIIRVLTGIGKVQIEGKNLNIDFFTNDEMKITGIIHNIQYFTGKDSSKS
ncbi:MAG: hypothetical protein K0S18_2029 [Anaerocolumna sp.]|jgi:sporulation protein YqfC|nr:hypothetical protein [Anaerocolumna sp.]